MPVIYVTHSLDEMLALGDHAVLLDGGRCADSGSIEDVVSNPANMAHLGLSGRVSVLKAEAKKEHSGIIRLHDSKLLIPAPQFKPGTKSWVTVRAEDVTISVKKPEGLSARNIMKGTVIGMSETYDHAVGLKIDIGLNIYATVTKEAVSELRIEKGSEVYIILKSIALSRRTTATIRQ